MVIPLSRKTLILQAVSVTVTLVLLIITMWLMDVASNSFEQEIPVSDWTVPLSIITLVSLLILVLFNLMRAFALLKEK